MGGLNSGRHRSHLSKPTTDDYRAIDIRYLSQQRKLELENTFTYRWFCYRQQIGSIIISTSADNIFLVYNFREKPHEKSKTCFQLIFLSWTPCYYGGKRPWLICPITGCGRRVAILYCRDVFACRHCHKLIYTSQNETITNRLIRRADGIRKALGWEPGIFNGRAIKPKGMHWQTFNDLVVEYDYYVDKSDICLAKCD